jgi:parallel beta-helix repeat protein
VFTGEPGTIVSGARQLTNFTRSGGYWVIGGQTQQGRATEASRCLSGYSSCQWPEDLFLDDRLLFRVTSLGEVGPGKWYFDYAADKIYLGDDPAGRKVETGVSAYAFGGSASSVTLRNLMIEKYAAPAQAAAVQGDNTTGWLIEDVRVRQAHGTGIRMGARWAVRRTRVDHNGQLGIAGGGTGSLVEDSEWDHNKTIGFQVGFAGGASKFFKTDGLVLRRNFIHHNDGNGIWLDIDNIRYLVEDNRVEDNYGQGIFVEISYGGKILGNQVRRNGHQRGGTWLYGAGILIAHSPDVEVAGNVVEDNYNGIAGIQQNRGTGQYGPRILQNLWVHDNIVRMSRGRSGVGDGTGTGAYSRNNRFDRNTYTLAGTAKYFAWIGGAVSDTEWRNAGQDVAGRLIR